MKSRWLFLALPGGAIIVALGLGLGMVFFNPFQPTKSISIDPAIAQLDNPDLTVDELRSIFREGAGPLPEVVARVDGEIITGRAVNIALLSARLTHEKMLQVWPNREEAERLAPIPTVRGIVDSMIEDSLLRIEMERRGIGCSEEEARSLAMDNISWMSQKAPDYLEVFVEEWGLSPGLSAEEYAAAPQVIAAYQSMCSLGEMKKQIILDRFGDLGKPSLDEENQAIADFVASLRDKTTVEIDPAVEALPAENPTQ